MAKNHTKDEEWRDIPGWVGLYQASSEGRIRSLPRWSESANRVYAGKVLSPVRHSSGYLAVNLTSRAAGMRKQEFIHRLVLMAFRGMPSAEQQACHNDGDQTNNRLSNLRWDSAKSNHADKRIHGTRQNGERNGNARLTKAHVEQIRMMPGRYADIAARFGVCTSTVGRIKRGESWRG